jgi:hypothetical protein
LGLFYEPEGLQDSDRGFNRFSYLFSAVEGQSCSYSYSCSTPNRIAPKGLKNLAQGFNPGNHQTRRFAERARDHYWLELDAWIDAFDLAPFQGSSQGRYGSQG